MADSSSTAKRREKWDSKAEFLLACIGYAVGLGNIWRFPYLCYKSGGGAFLIPYFVMLIFCGIPLLYMEMAVGQLTRLGPVHAIAKLCPLLKGTGVAMVAITFILCTYYNVIIAWALHYLFNSFADPLPWKSCNNAWNSHMCKDESVENSSMSVGYNYHDSENNSIFMDTISDYLDSENNSISMDAISNYLDSENISFLYPFSTSPSEEYFRNAVLRVSGGIDNMGDMIGSLVGYLFLAWVICYLCLFKGVKSVGKVVYFTATFPYLILIVLLVRSVTLPGSLNGIFYFIYPDWNKLLDPQIWMTAAVQNFNSIGIGFGTLITYSSYNSKRNNIWHDTLTISVINSFTSILAGFVVFSALGNIAENLGVSVSDAVHAGPELVFVALPSLFNHLPYPNIWAISFFLMVIFLGLDSQFSMVEVINTSIMDQLSTNCTIYQKEIVALVVCTVCFLFGLPHVSQGGIYTFTMFDYYGAHLSLMYIAYAEVLAICWLYGANRLAREISFASGYRPFYFFPFCWLFVSPLMIGMIMQFNASFSTGDLYYGDYLFPPWTKTVGYMITLGIVCSIPIGLIHALVTARGPCGRKCCIAMTPTFDPHNKTQISVVETNVVEIPLLPMPVPQPAGANATVHASNDEFATSRNPEDDSAAACSADPPGHSPPPNYDDVKDIERKPFIP